MNKPVIVIDLDNVLARSVVGFVAASNRLFGTKLTPAEYQENWPAMWGVTHEEAVRRANVMIDHNYQWEYEPMPGAQPVLTELSKRYKLVTLTSRRQVVEALTREWLEKYYPGIFQGITFAGFWEDPEVPDGHLLTKGEQYRQLGAAYVIDDHLKHCASAAECEASAILFGDYAWNQHAELPAGVTRCADWSAVERYFKGAANYV